MTIEIKLKCVGRAEPGAHRYIWRARVGLWTFKVHADTPRQALERTVRQVIRRIDSRQNLGAWLGILDASKFGAPKGLPDTDHGIKTRGPLAYSTAQNDALIAQAVRLATRTDDRELITRIVWPQPADMIE